MKKDKIIKVEVSTHKDLKTMASSKGKTLKDFVQDIVLNLENGLFFDVEEYSNDVLIAVFADISKELDSRNDNGKMTKEQIDNYIYTVENIPFGE
jgi:hypothetical protein